MWSSWCGVVGNVFSAVLFGLMVCAVLKVWWQLLVVLLWRRRRRQGVVAGAGQDAGWHAQRGCWRRCLTTQAGQGAVAGWCGDWCWRLSGDAGKGAVVMPRYLGSMAASPKKRTCSCHCASALTAPKQYLDQHEVSVVEFSE